MIIPEPEIGMVISYEFLWHHEADKGQIYGRKDRPSVIVLSMEEDNGKTKVIVAPITHTESDVDFGLEIPLKVKKHLGLDDERSWIVTSELNEFYWPGFDLKPIKNSSSYVYGFLPPKLFFQLKEKIRTCYKNTVINRDD